MPSTPPPGGEALTLHLTERGNMFIPDTLTATGSATITLVLDNQDPGPHNFALYPSSTSSDPIFRSPVVTGPANLTYTFTAPDANGIYYFRSDPDSGMTGILVIRSRILYGY
jgi:plastocyanin